ncbi:CDP-glycerol glycerophosphotransferase family protein [Arthrobacter sp.]|uniref:CDP-glycerol glycerophosphotransferase family protein n=1 Tax=Arthrobacter sp. TaxID=1667 RepID=UPI003A8D3565
MRENVIFYESFSGRGALCNPEALFTYLLVQGDMQSMEHVWAMRDPHEKSIFDAKYGRLRNVRSVILESDEYWRELCTAKYLFNNATFPPSFTKRPEQVYTNTWHGTPLKTMGYDSNEGPHGARNILRNFCQADFLVSPNSFTTNQMYRSAYRLEGIYRGAIIEQGYPRIDYQFEGEREVAETKEVLEAFGLGPLDGQVVVYAPTWKGPDFQNPVNEAHLLLDRALQLEEATGLRVLLKVHQQVYKMALEIPEIKSYLIPHSIPANKVLSIADVLVTDYSSIFFDFLASEKPMIFFAPDQTQYNSTRGVYLDELPGPILDSIEELIATLKCLGTGGGLDPITSHEEARSRAKALYCSKETGNSTKRVVDIVMRGNPDQLPLVTDFSTAKEALLLYIGGMRNNGITTAALNLLQNLDYERFDVSIFAPQKSGSRPEYLYDRIPSSVRQFLRQGTHPLSRGRNDKMKAFLESTETSLRDMDPEVQEVFDAEWQRCFGATQFDYIVDFSGYAGFWSHILLAGQARKSYSVWQHNDLLRDRDKTVNGKKPNFTSLNSQFNSYRFFDNVVSVSEDLRNVNRKNLSEYAYPTVFGFSRNSLDTNKIRSAMELEPSADTRGEIKDLNFRNIEAVFDGLLERYSQREIQRELSDALLRQALFSSRGTTRFVTAGRLSPEKNQARLLKAFADVFSEFPNIELIILGDGALREELQALTKELGIDAAVTFTGMVDNPLDLMKRCDCFVLSSDYEGQPMVLLEASCLRLPIITVNFGSIGQSLPEERGVVVEQDVNELSQAMRSFVLSDNRLEVRFDFQAYNHEVVDEFYTAIGAVQTVRSQAERFLA